MKTCVAFLDDSRFLFLSQCVQKPTEKRCRALRKREMDMHAFKIWFLYHSERTADAAGAEMCLSSFAGLSLQ